MFHTGRLLVTTVFATGLFACELGEPDFEDDFGDGEFEEDDSVAEPPGDIEAVALGQTAVRKIKTDGRSRKVAAAFVDYAPWNGQCPNSFVYGALTVTYRASSTFIHIDRIRVSNYASAPIEVGFAQLDTFDEGVAFSRNIKQYRSGTVTDLRGAAARASGRIGRDSHVDIRIDVQQVDEPWFCGGSFGLQLQK